MADKDCPVCKGTGILKVTEGLRCAACDGSGRLLDAPCICCNGEGVQQVIVKAICPSCGD